MPTASSSRVTKKLEDLRLKADTLEKERDFYFSKLRNFEVYAKNYPDKTNDAMKTESTLR
jgi:hypothetical protein